VSYLIKGQARADGVTRLAGPGTAELRYLTFDLLRLPAGGTYTLPVDGKETVVYLLAGHGAVSGDGLARPLALGPRRSVFADPPSAVYLPPQTGARIAADAAGIEAALVRAPSASRAPAVAVGPADAERRVVGASNWQRTVYNVVDAARGAQRLLVGETLNPPGNWSSYPPHKHDARTSAGELPMEEVYFYLTRPAGGFGLQMLFTAPGHPAPIDGVYRVEAGDLLAIPRGYHPVVAAAGYELFYLWAMAGEESVYGAWSDDPAYAWVRERERELLQAGTAPGHKA